jgi:exonuclease SbcD
LRLLHTADWHVGKPIRGRSRSDEFAAAIDEVVGIAVQEGVDWVLVAGDVWEHRVPSPEAAGLVFDATIRLHEAGLGAVLIPGNHDSPQLFRSLAGLVGGVGSFLVPQVVPPKDGGILRLPSRDGSEELELACIPFVPERRFGDAAALFEASESWYQSYVEGMGSLLAAVAAGFTPGASSVILGHFFTDGALVTPGGGERELTIGMAYAVPPSRLPGTVSYVALGHVHLPQAVKGSPAPARYAGSLLQLDFGESGQRKSVSIVDVQPGVPAKVTEIPLTSGRRLTDLRGTFDEVVAQGAAAGDAHLRVYVQTDGPVPGLADRVRQELPNALDIHLVYDRDEYQPSETPVSSLQPRDQFVAYYRRQHQAEPPDEILSAFDEVLDLELHPAQSGPETA